jgi:phosphoribosylglycinamide formyltransferase-1
MKNALVFASGSQTGGGSGAARLVEESRSRNLGFEVVGLVSHHADGGVVNHARRLGVPYEVVTLPVLSVHYENLMRSFKADLVCLSGWLKPVTGLPTDKVINIHPGSFPVTSGLHGHHVHERMIRARDEDGVMVTHVTMHFVTPFMKRTDGSNNYDTGPVFASVPIEILPNDTAETLGARVNKMEHQVQFIYTALVAQGLITLRGERVVMEDESWLTGKNLPVFQ